MKRQSAVCDYQFIRELLSVFLFLVDLARDSAPALSKAGTDRPTLKAVSGLIGLVK
jgi:hypothetical protein